ncbi:MAG: serine hydrolase, partial [Clostridia bacterium]|nr:serine hydrolase [Clostridia bacterium]
MGTGMSIKTEFVYASPEDMGISSQAIRNFLERLENHKLPMHSFLLMRHGKLLSETYYEPYSADIPHRMFSITKSFTSLAIGFLEDEGKLSLDDKIVGFFPEKQPEGGADPLIAKTTVRDMLRMASPHDKTTYKQIEIDDWVKTFFIAEPKHLPGAFFAYDTSATHTLTALVEKLTGQSLLDYLRCKFLDEIGFSKDAYALKDPM